MTSLVGKKLDRYEVVDEIGNGAVGRVYLAQDPLIGRLVAIKAFEPTNGKAGAWPRLKSRPPALHEARAAGILSHPNIVTIHDVVDRREDTVPFIAMEYVRGTDLKAILAPGKALPLDFTISVVNQIAAALDYAHGNGVIHGDVKPANILITDTEKVKITDFGIARRQDENNEEHIQLVGTPSYVAPEQILTGNVDHRADLFALGVVLHEMLTGRLPYRGRTSEEILHEIAEEPVLRVQRNGVALSPGVEHVLERALQKDPERRYSSAGELAEALRREADLDAVSTSTSAETGEILVAPRPAPLRPRDLTVRLKTRWWTSLRKTRELAHLARVRLSLEWLRTPKRRLAVVVAAALLIPSILGGAALLAVSSRGSRAIISDEEHQLRLSYVPLVQEGHRKMVGGDPEAAAEVYRRAEAAAPSVESLARHRERAEREIAALETYSETETRIRDLLEASQAALVDGRLTRARSLANEALTLDPEREAARRIVLAAAGTPVVPVPRAAPVPQKVEARPLDMPSSASGARTGRAPATSGAVSDPPVSPAPAKLRVDFFSHAPKGVLTLYSDTDQILRHPYRFVKKSGFLRRKGISGRYESTLELPPGESEIKIYVTAGNKSAELVTLPLSMATGETRHLRVVIDAKGQVTAKID